VRTRVGYAGGSTPDPTYHSIGDHAEAFQLDFDTTKTSYEQLFADAFAGFRAGRGPSRGQYMTAAYPTTDAQARLAVERGVPAIANARFYLAEDYHQKYYLRHDSILMRELAELTPQQLVDSTVAARLNGYVSRRGTLEQLRAELPALKLSPEAAVHLERLLTRRA
jgi:peptide-methionine (S)-S-oxide reductase